MPATPPPRGKAPPGRDRERDDDDDDFEHIESELDDLSHAEFLTLYKEAGDNLLFAKQKQWHSMAYLTLAFVAIYLLARANVHDLKFVNYLSACSFILSIFAIVTEIFLQFWQINEQRKIRDIAEHLSTSAQHVRSLKSSGESDIHRYIMLFMLMAYIVMAQIALIRALWNLTG
ncbi:hypothetical protein O4H49_02510 [Kiloniella laminariae]|uniref:Uncharacterized protein n=1 Tax=Kiloniella laminariae TaxID=454162 RepID=A0ABT4LEW2_9PROT|nr:hypothetical protein [Kiloniella laminariae]MCZ4279633.1 hypothetical protein [Kiloniella laminariae]